MDEFSDFQMAVQVPASNAGGMGVPPPIFGGNHLGISTPAKVMSSSGIRFSSDSSPVHSIASHNPKSEMEHSNTNSNQSTTPSYARAAVNKFGASVGSRLANYDLGLSGPVPQTNGFQNHEEFSLSTTSAFPNFPKTINNFTNYNQPQQPTQRSNQDLLIGEEDKYSALRMLIETDISSNSSSIFEKPVMDVMPTTATQNHMKKETIEARPTNSAVNGVPSSINMNSAASPTTLFDLNISNSINSNNSSVVNSYNLTGALKFPSPNKTSSTPVLSVDDETSDFGDFQSFSGFAPTPAKNDDIRSNHNGAIFSTPPSVSLANNNPSSLPLTKDSFLDHFQCTPPILPPLSTTHMPTPQIPKSVNSIVEQPLTGTSNQKDTSYSDEGDAEFGDFVSVEPTIPTFTSTQLPPVPPPAPLPSNSIWNKHLDLSPLALIQQTPPPAPPPLQEDTENNEDIMDIGGYFSNFASPLDNELPYPPTKTEKTTNLARSEITDIDDDFDTFSGFKSATICNNSSTSNNNSDQGKIVDCFTSKSSAPIDGADILTKSYQTNNITSPSMPSSTFIRTSLIRNDKVTDIDPIKWNQSVEESNNDSTLLEYNSFDRKDFSSPAVGKTKFLDVSPETRSIASLDLGNYVTADYSETGNINNNFNNNNTISNGKSFQENLGLSSNNSHHQSNGMKTSSSGTAGSLPFHQNLGGADESIIYDEYDKYQCFRQECENEKERYYNEWSRCLIACKGMITTAYSFFNGVSASEVIKEVVANEKGYSYMMNILEIYRISQRIQKSALKLGINSRLEHTAVEITQLWESLSAFLLGTCVSTEICQDASDLDECYIEDPSSTSPMDSPPPSCGVCLCIINTSESSQFLDYGGKIYHCKCANFWINEVDTILPSLSYLTNGNSDTGTCSNFQSDSGKLSSKFDKNNSLV